jgi:hypothetical protein
MTSRSYGKKRCAATACQPAPRSINHAYPGKCYLYLLKMIQLSCSRSVMPQLIRSDINSVSAILAGNRIIILFPPSHGFMRERLKRR